MTNEITHGNLGIGEVTLKINLVGVVGAGVMGSDVALDLACNGYRVVIVDIDEMILDKSDEKMKKTFSLMKMMSPKYRSLDWNVIDEKIEFHTEYKALSHVDLIIENVTEDWNVKKAVYEELREVCKEDTLFAVNTSCISITKIAGLMKRPDNVLGTHFMNPVPMKTLVEVIKGHHTSEATVETVTAFLKSMNKVPVVVNDFPGFVTNRVLMLTINESIWLVHDRVGRPQDVDKIFRLGFGHEMGPLATGDLIGLDTILKSLEVLHDSYNDPKYRPCPLLRKMVDAGLLGKKSGQGFYTYDKRN